MNDPMVKAVHGLIDHAANIDHKLAEVMAQLERLGIKLSEAQMAKDDFDPEQLNKIVD